MQRAVHYKIHIKKADFYQIINKTPLITYGMFIKDKTRKFKSDIFNTQNWKY
ncbi:hypothetical protein V682_02794, partial [Staphylococcus aureus H32175]